MEQKELTGNVVIITGAARNMGRAFALHLAEKGASVVVHYHNEQSRDDAAETVRLIENRGAKAGLFAGDLANVQTVKALFAYSLQLLGQVNIVINNAGLVIKKPFTDITEEDFDRSFGTNTKAAFFVMQEAARVIADNGRIINMGTTILGATIPYYSVYAGAKAPLEDFTRALAKEIGHRGITVNVVAPGPIDTAFYHGAETPQSEARAAQASVAQRLGNIEDIVPVIGFLTSAGAQWVTAQTIFVNGGYLAR